MVAKKTKKPTAKKTVAKSQTVDYYPNRVPFYVAVVAVTILVGLAVLTGL